MKCNKLLVMTGYRVQFVDLREPKPRTPREEIHVADNAWIDACGLLGIVPADRIRDWYEAGGYKVISIETIKPKRIIQLDLCQLWESAEPPATEAQAGEEVQRND